MELLFPRACQYSNGGRQINLSGEVMPNFFIKIVQDFELFHISKWFKRLETSLSLIFNY
jgi:hypothetical protein